MSNVIYLGVSFALACLFSQVYRGKLRYVSHHSILTINKFLVDDYHHFWFSTTSFLVLLKRITLCSIEFGKLYVGRDVTFDVIVDILTEKPNKISKQLASATRFDQNHPLYSPLSSCLSFGRTRYRYMKIKGCK